MRAHKSWDQITLGSQVSVRDVSFTSSSSLSDGCIHSDSVLAYETTHYSLSSSGMVYFYALLTIVKSESGLEAIHILPIGLELKEHCARVHQNRRAQHVPRAKMNNVDLCASV